MSQNAMNYVARRGHVEVEVEVYVGERGYKSRSRTAQKHYLALCSHRMLHFRNWYFVFLLRDAVQSTRKTL
jgi:hypothetical protein